MAGGITSQHFDGELDPAGDANAQDDLLIAHSQAIDALIAAQPQFRDLGAGTTFPTSGPGGTPLQHNDAFDLG